MIELEHDAEQLDSIFAKAEKFIQPFIDSASDLYELGKMYYYGDDIEQNFIKAFMCYERAFYKEKNYSIKNEIQNCIAFMYLYGEGVSKNYSKAKKLFISTDKHETPEFKLLNAIFGNTSQNSELEKAVEQNDSISQFRLGNYFYEKGRKNDFIKAFDWYMKAAEQNNPDAQNMIGNLYNCGLGVSKNKSEAFRWYKQAMKNKNENAKYNLMIMLKDETFEENNHFKAKQYLEELLNTNNPELQSLIAKQYYNGLVEKDYEKSFWMAERAKKNGSRDVLNFLPFIRIVNIPILAATKDNSIDIIQKLLKTGIDINAKYEYGITALMVAAMYNSVDATKLLLSKGVDINSQDEEQRTAISYAAIYNSIEVAKLLCDNGATLDIEPIKQDYYPNMIQSLSPIMYAAIHNSFEVAQLLIKEHVKLNQKIHRSKETVLTLAIKNKSTDIIRLLIDSGVNLGGIFTEAIKSNSINIIKLLIDSGMYCGKTAYKQALTHGHVHIAKLIFDYNTELSINTFIKENSTILDFFPEDIEAFKTLLIKTGQAKRIIYYKNGKIETNYWTPTNLSYKSDLLTIIKSHILYKNSEKDGVFKIRFLIEGASEEPQKRYQQNNFVDSITKQSKALNKSNNENYEKAIKIKKYLDFHMTSCITNYEEIVEQYYKEYDSKNDEIRIKKEFKNKTEPFSNNSLEAILQTPAEVQFELGLLYEEEQNFEIAEIWYLAAIYNNNDKAKIKLGDIYHFENGFQKNLSITIELYKSAANNGLSEAQYKLGLMYEEGEGIDKDYKKAAGWLEKAALQGYAQAQYKIGLFYWFGEGVEKDISKARFYLQEAAKQGSIEAYKALDRMKKE